MVIWTIILVFRVNKVFTFKISFVFSFLPHQSVSEDQDMFNIWQEKAEINLKSCLQSMSLSLKRKPDIQTNMILCENIIVPLIKL